MKAGGPAAALLPAPARDHGGPPVVVVAAPVVEGPLRGGAVQLPGFHNIALTYTKRFEADMVALRNKFNSSARKNFLKKIGTDPHAVAQLKQAGFSDDDIEEIGKGV